MGVLAPQKSYFTPVLACTNLQRKKRKRKTCKVQKTQNRKCSAIFKDGRRRYLENRLNALSRPEFDKI
jgi:hypothetical protein